MYDFLCKNRADWYTSREISAQLGVSIGSVTMSLKKLRKTNIIQYKNTGKRNTYQYRVS
ncbi:MAG: winged helix-turn-helix domain-containing protein [Nanoarchaeota archaeon]